MQHNLLSGGAGCVHIEWLSLPALEKLSANRVRFIHSTLHHALDDAVRTGLVAKNVCDSVTLPRLVRREMQVLTSEQARKVVEAGKGVAWRLCCFWP